MQLYGYQKDSDTLLNLEEVSLQCTLEELEKVINFLSESRNEHAKVIDNNSMRHSHFKDFVPTWKDGQPDLIIVTKEN